MPAKKKSKGASSTVQKLRAAYRDAKAKAKSAGRALGLKNGVHKGGQLRLKTRKRTKRR